MGNKVFKVGDRVNCYGNFAKQWLSTTNGSKGFVKEVHPSGRITVEFDEPDNDGNIAREMIYPQQCRRLKPKKKACEFKGSWKKTKVDLVSFQIHFIPDAPYLDIVKLDGKEMTLKECIAQKATE